MVDNKADGIGKQEIKIYDCIITYEGEWKEGLRDGFGKYFNNLTNASYVGEYKDDLMHGHGR